MGGYGSGRTCKVGRQPRHKSRVEWLPCLNSFKCMPGKIAEQNGMTTAKFGHYNITVTKDYLTVVSLNCTPIFQTPMKTIHSGLGKRYLFTCPHCRARTSRLYYAQTIGCRKCLNLSYHSQNISNEDRWFLRRERLLERFGVTFVEATQGRRRSGMHKATFTRFIEEFNFLNEIAINIHFNRFQYGRMVNLLRERRECGEFLQTYKYTTF